MGMKKHRVIGKWCLVGAAVLALSGCASGPRAGKSAVTRELEALLHASREVDAGRGEAAEAMLAELGRDERSLSETGSLYLQLVLAEDAAKEKRWLDSAMHLMLVHEMSPLSSLGESIRPRVAVMLEAYLKGLVDGTGAENTNVQKVDSWKDNERGLAEEAATRLIWSAEGESEHVLRDDMRFWLVQFLVHHGNHHDAQVLGSYMLRGTPKTRHDVALASILEHYGWGEWPAAEEK